MFYLVTTPWWLRLLYRRCTWRVPGAGKTLYLTFDDGPHPEATSFVLEQLEQYGAKATFFCIGKNVKRYPGLYQRILDEGHTAGNHTHNHLNGWKTDDNTYLANIQEASALIHSPLFRPPYGRIRHSQLKKMDGYRVVMWSLLSGDFDPGITGEKCAANVIKHAAGGDVVVFHDSEKALGKLRFALPLVLRHFAAEGFIFKALPC